jgi:tripartite-type tricarboxylate transporter receptor subunit TctC
MNQITRRAFVRALATAPLLPGLAHAQGGDVIKIIVGVPPGGTTDLMARLMGKELAEELKVSTVIENRPGASGIIGGAYVAHSAPDGHTLLMDASSHATAPFLYPDMPFKTDKDLIPVALVASTPYVLAVHPKLGVSTVKELLALLKAHPGQYSYASSGPGTAQHLAAEMLKRQAGVQMTHVPYRGSGAAIPDVLAGRVPILFENIAVMTPYIKHGAMRALAVTSKDRVPFLPDVPTMEESGLADFEVLGWFALWAPANTPPEEITRLNAAVNKSLKKRSVLKQLAAVGAQPMEGTPEQQARWQQAEEAKWGGLIRELGIKL